VGPDPDPDFADTLLVQWQPAYAVLKVPRLGRALLGWAIVSAVLAAIALLVSWTGSGQVRLAGSVGSAVFGVLAVLLACGEPPDPWQIRWDQVRGQLEPAVAPPFQHGATAVVDHDGPADQAASWLSRSSRPTTAVECASPCSSWREWPR
jgi:hypothetical protein